MIKKAPSYRTGRSATPMSPDGESSAHHMVPIRIPAVLRLKDGQQDIPGLTHSIGLTRLRLFTGQVLGSGSPLSLQFRMGSGICYLNVAGQVISCLPSQEADAGKFLIEVQLSAVREFEQRMLQSAIEEVAHDPSARRESLLTIHGTRDTLAEEAMRLVEVAPLEPVNGATVHADEASDPPWVAELRRRIKPHWEAVLECRLIQEASKGTLSLERMRGWIVQMYPFIETFPKWIALTIARAPDMVTRGFMIDNIRVEKRHAAQWIQMAEGFGLTKSELETVSTFPEVDALTHWLWSVNTQGSLAEAVSATNYAVEGVTQGIAQLTVQGFPQYEGLPTVHLDKKAYAWMHNHARYDELHPIQALEVMKLYTTKDLEEKVIFASQRSLEYLLIALEACYTHFGAEEDLCERSVTKKTAKSRMG